MTIERELMVFEGVGTNIDVWSKTFVDKHPPLAYIRNVPLTINHASRESTEATNEMVAVIELQLEDYAYRYK